MHEKVTVDVRFKFGRFALLNLCTRHTANFKERTIRIMFIFRFTLESSNVNVLWLAYC